MYIAKVELTWKGVEPSKLKGGGWIHRGSLYATSILYYLNLINCAVT